MQSSIWRHVPVWCVTIPKIQVSIKSNKSQVHVRNTCPRLFQRLQELNIGKESKVKILSILAVIRSPNLNSILCLVSSDENRKGKYQKDDFVKYHFYHLAMTTLPIQLWRNPLWLTRCLFINLAFQLRKERIKDYVVT